MIGHEDAPVLKNYAAYYLIAVRSKKHNGNKWRRIKNLELQTAGLRSLLIWSTIFSMLVRNCLFWICRWHATMTSITTALSSGTWLSAWTNECWRKMLVAKNHYRVLITLIVKTLWSRKQQCRTQMCLKHILDCYKEHEDVSKWD